MAKKEYNWSDDPWNEEKQAADEEELKRASRKGFAVVGVLAIIVLLVLVLGPGLLTAFLLLAGSTV